MDRNETKQILKLKDELGKKIVDLNEENITLKKELHKLKSIVHPHTELPEGEEYVICYSKGSAFNAFYDKKESCWFLKNSLYIPVNTDFQWAYPKDIFK